MPLEKEQRAITRGEELGFTSREPSETKELKAEGNGMVMRRHVPTPTQSRALDLLLAPWSSAEQYP